MPETERRTPADLLRDLLADLKRIEQIYERDRVAHLYASEIERIFDRWLYEDQATLEAALRQADPPTGETPPAGEGALIGIDVDILDGPDRSVIDPMTSAAMQYLPVADGARLVRPRPPYWSSVDRVACCEIGDIVDWPATS